MAACGRTVWGSWCVRSVRQGRGREGRAVDGGTLGVIESIEGHGQTDPSLSSRCIAQNRSNGAEGARSAQGWEERRASSAAHASVIVMPMEACLAGMRRSRRASGRHGCQRARSGLRTGWMDSIGRVGGAACAFLPSRRTSLRKIRGLFAFSANPSGRSMRGGCQCSACTSEGAR